jgi:hypothetical protein
MVWGLGLWLRDFRWRERNLAEALEQDVEVSSSREFGDAVGACAGETLEDLVDGEGDFRLVKPLEVLAKGAPAGEG